QRLDKLIETKIDGSRQQIPAEIIADLAERKIDLNQEDYEKKPAVKKNVDELVDLAKKAANAIGINYAAADIIKVENE
ncbi:19708_t:CDS:2, partial [Racocetra persica]